MGVRWCRYIPSQHFSPPSFLLTAVVVENSGLRKPATNVRGRTKQGTTREINCSTINTTPVAIAPFPTCFSYARYINTGVYVAPIRCHDSFSRGQCTGFPREEELSFCRAPLPQPKGFFETPQNVAYLPPLAAPR